MFYSFDVIERQEHQLPFFSSAIVTRPIVLNSQHIDVNTHTPAAREGKGEKYNKNVVCGDDNCVNGKKKKEVPEKEKNPSWYYLICTTERKFTPFKKRKKKREVPATTRCGWMEGLKRARRLCIAVDIEKSELWHSKKRLSTRQLSSSFLFPYIVILDFIFFLFEMFCRLSVCYAHRIYRRRRSCTL